VPKRQPDELVKAINWMLDHYEEYNAERLRAVGKLYSLDNVGRYMKGIYSEVLSSAK